MASGSLSEASLLPLLHTAAIRMCGFGTVDMYLCFSLFGTTVHSDRVLNTVAFVPVTSGYQLLTSALLQEDGFVVESRGADLTC